MIKIIINADDFGIREETSLLIRKAIESRSLSSTTILANGPSKELATDCHNDFPFASYGIHLNLTSFESVTHSKELYKYGVTDDKGVFTGKMKTMNTFPQDLLEAIKQELSAQIEVVLGLGVPLSHADSHHHIHTKKGLIETVGGVLKEYGIKRVRKAQELEGLTRFKHFFTGREIKQVNKYYSDNFITADFFYGVVPFYQKLSRNGEKQQDDSIVELMCHLGHSHQQEKKIIDNKEIEKYIQYKLISYNDL